ncbi:hypothetical protein JCM19241_5613 [Vibrio ishigakensis]|uniref:Uncharacterized protein n=1 Tax=Vibrio ishigakensis TaxID=1481914 RepID=A0A0B8QBY6_9VIBR|nr:hypothetical protein JCM19241_5613 [Vibrio ishigakensis]
MGSLFEKMVFLHDLVKEEQVSDEHQVDWQVSETAMQITKHLFGIELMITYAQLEGNSVVVGDEASNWFMSISLYEGTKRKACQMYMVRNDRTVCELDLNRYH